MRRFGSSQQPARPDRPAAAEFDAFVTRVEPQLRTALVATYGAVDGRSAVVDALSWAWEHWDRVLELDRPVGYLYRVGQTAAARYRVRPLPTIALSPARPDDPATEVVDREVIGALAQLPEQQRTSVLLVHGYGWSQVDVAELLGVTPSTVSAHLRRALPKLAALLEMTNAS